MDISKLTGHVPDTLLQQLPAILTQFGIDGPFRLSHLLGQAKHESAGFVAVRENLNYSGTALWSLFHSHFSSLDEAVSYARQPEKIANRIYSNRMGNSDEASGDGWNYKGRGYLQTTGKSNYTALGKFLGVDLLSNPDLVATDYPLSSAAFFFSSHNLWSICDKGIGTDTITAITKAVNGGILGLQERTAYTQDFYHILTT